LIGNIITVRGTCFIRFVKKLGAARIDTVYDVTTTIFWLILLTTSTRSILFVTVMMVDASLCLIVSFLIEVLILLVMGRSTVSMISL
jgi:hypothetical protein